MRSSPCAAGCSRRCRGRHAQRRRFRGARRGGACRTASIARGVNAPDSASRPGPVALIAELEALLAADDIDTARVHIDVAAHSSMLEPILAEFGRFCRTIGFRRRQIPYVSNLTGTWITAADVTDPATGCATCAAPYGSRMACVLCWRSGSRALLEVGPGRTLASLCRQQPTKAAVVTTALRHPNEADV